MAQSEICAIISFLQGMKMNTMPFGVLILIRAAQTELLAPDAIKSKVLGNALAVAQNTTFPASVELGRYEFYRTLTDAQRKLVAAEIDRSRYPNYDSSKSIAAFIANNWTAKTHFEKRPAPVAVKPVRKTASKKPVTTATVVYKKSSKL